MENINSIGEYYSWQSWHDKEVSQYGLQRLKSILKRLFHTKYPCSLLENVCEEFIEGKCLLFEEKNFATEAESSVLLRIHKVTSYASIQV